MKTKKITQKDLDNVINFIIGTETIEMENNNAATQSTAYEYMMNGKIITMQQRKNNFKKVTIDDVVKISNIIFDQNKLNIVIGSNKSTKENFFTI